jgi:flagellar biosynthetic protein FliR
MDYFLYHFELFLLLFVRMFGMFVVSPFFSSPLIGVSLRSMLAFLITIVIFPVIAKTPIPIPDNIWLYAGLVITELLIGILFGFIASIFMAVFQMAGEYFSMLIGLSIAEIMDPLTQAEVPIIGQFQTLVATLVFLAIYGDHMLLSAVYASYTALPVLDFADPKLMGMLTDNLMRTVSLIFSVSLKLAFPLMGTLIILVVSLALLSKAAPQMNIFMVGFPAQLSVGYLGLVFVAPLFARASARVFELMHGNILSILAVLR